MAEVIGKKPTERELRQKVAVDAAIQLMDMSMNPDGTTPFNASRVVMIVATPELGVPKITMYQNCSPDEAMQILAATARSAFATKVN